MNVSLKKYVKVLPAFLTPLFLTLSFPDHDQGWLIWIALVPLLVVSDGLRPSRSFCLGLAVGMISMYGIFLWAFSIPGLRFYHGIAVAFYLGLYPAAWCAIVSSGRRTGLAPVIVAPAAWVSLDFLKAHAGFLSFPWASLAHSQHDHPAVLQISAITGEYGVTFLIVLVNAALASALLKSGRYRQQVVAAGAVLCVLIFGIFQLSTDSPPRYFRVAAVQPCISPGEQDRDPGQANTLYRLEGLTTKAALSLPNLIVWPETAVLNLPSSPKIVGRLEGISRRHDIPLLIGASERVKFNNYSLDRASNQGIRSYNGAHLIHTASGPPQEPYRKNVLVPFGEYLPLSDTITWPSWFIAEGFQTMPGDGLTIFTLKDGTRPGVLICWENLFPQLARREVRAGADLLVNLVNDAWLGKKHAPAQHNSASVLRAVENGVPVIVASNWGPSLIIDPRGRVLQRSKGFFRDTIAGDVPLQNKKTLYTRYGDVFAWICITTMFLVFICIAVNSISLRKSTGKR